MEHIGVLIDSDVLIEHLRGNEDATAKIRSLEEEGEYLYTTTINSFELYYGAYKSKKVEKNIRAVDELLKRLRLLPLDGPSSKAAARNFGRDVRKRGTHRVQRRPYRRYNNR